MDQIRTVFLVKLAKKYIRKYIKEVREGKKKKEDFYTFGHTYHMGTRVSFAEYRQWVNSTYEKIQDLNNTEDMLMDEFRALFQRLK